MKWNTLTAAGLVAPATALLRFPCSSLTVQRLDPLVNPGQNPSTHLHQIVGGNSFNVSMDPTAHDPPTLSTCTTCQFVEDMSNYWTAVVYFKSRNGTYKRVPQVGQDNNGAKGGGMMVYYMSDALFDTAQKTKVTAFKSGFRMLVGDSSFSSRAQARKYRQLTYTCMQNAGSRNPETLNFPAGPCPYAIMANHRFPTCWDGKNTDSPNHYDHMAYPETLTFEAGGACPATHPVKVPQVLFETLWVTKEFNNKADWPEDGSQPFVWSTGDGTGFSSHADYLFGWKGDALQRNMDAKGEYMSVKALTRQNIQAGNKCEVKDMVHEQFDGWLPYLPGLGPMIKK